MASPSNAVTTQRADLADSFMEFDLESQARNFINDRVFPVVEVSSQAGQFGKIPIEELLQDRKADRAPHSAYNRGDFNFVTVNYATKELGLEEGVDDREETMYRDFFSASSISTMRAFNGIMTNAETKVSDAVMNGTTWTGAALQTTVADWKVITRDVILDVENASIKVYENCGLWPNTVIISRKIFRAIRRNDDIIDRSKAQNFQDVRAGLLNEQAMASIFDVDQVLVGNSTKNTANEGAAASLASIWPDNNVMVCVTATSDDFKEPCIGRQFHWSADGSDRAGVVEQYRDEVVRSNIFRVRRDAVEIVLYVEAGHLLINTDT